MIKASRAAALAFLSMALIAACKKTPETAAVPVPNGNAPGPTCDAACLAARADSARRAREDSIARADAATRAAREAELASTRATLTAVILFDYDADALSGEARAALDAKLPILRANSGVRIRISGHADERGSDEYNLALGQRRAASAKRYLTDQGIDGSRIDIITFGEERPVGTDGTEDSFRRNRRAEFEITAGGDTMVPVR